MKPSVVAGVLCALGVVSGTSASSPAAWDSFRAEVRARCLAAAKGSVDKIRIRVDPHGSESYGVALVKGVDRVARTPVTYVCVTPKGKAGAELSGETGDFTSR